MATRRRSRWQQLRRRLQQRVAGTRRSFKSWQRIRRQARRLRRGGRPVVWLMLTTSARMGNLGDQAQAAAVERWLREDLGLDAVEVDRDEYRSLERLLPRLLRPGELILLQSGGNMGERGHITESQRRSIIARYAANPIISLPQTISFSDTPRGRAAAAETARIYTGHGDLEVVARDEISLERGAELLGSRICRRMAPDPVLRMRRAWPRDGRSGVLLVLRSDAERRLTAEQHRALEAALEGRPVTRFDTKVERPIRRARRTAEVEDIFALFARHEVVVTDRFHGMVFAFVSDTPCVVFENIDHKIRAGVDWLDGCASVQLLDADAPLAPAIDAVLAADPPSRCGEVDARLDAAWEELSGLVRARAFGDVAAGSA